MLSGNGKTTFVGGPSGPPNTLSIGTVTTGAAGSQAQATIGGTAPAQTLNLVIPKGDQGLTGAVPWAPIVQWASGLVCVASAPATLVYVGGTAYVCLVSHIAGTFAADLAAGKWAPIAPGGLQPWKTQPVAWAAYTAYSASAPADVVTNGGGCYVCSVSHTSGATFDATKWTQIAAPGSVTGALLASNNLADLASVPGARANLGLAESGRPIQRFATPSSAVATSTATLTINDTAPTTGNTTVIPALSVSITPKAATNKLRVRVTLQCSVSVACTALAAIFRDAGATAAAANMFGVTAGQQAQITVTCEVAAGSTSQTTFSAGVSQNAAGTLTVNGSGGARLLGGACFSQIEVEEYAA